MAGDLLLLVAAAAGWWFFIRVPGAYRPALTSREIATRVLAEQLARVHPGAKALVFGNPFTLRTGQDPEIYAFEQAGIRGLQAGFGSPDAIKVVYPELRQEFFTRPEAVFVDPKTTTPLSFLIAEGEFDRLVKANPGFELIVSLIGVPPRITSSEAWNSDKRHFGLLLPDWRLIGHSDEVRQAVKSGKVAAAVVNRPGAPPSNEIDRFSNYRAEFDRRFLLVTEGNIDDMLETYPKLW